MPREKPPILFSGREHTNCDPMCDDCRECMDRFAETFRPVVRELVDEVYSFLERRIAGYKREGEAEQQDLTDVLAECLFGGVFEQIPPDGPGWPDVRRRVHARRISYLAREARNGN